MGIATAIAEILEYTEPIHYISISCKKFKMEIYKGFGEITIKHRPYYGLGIRATKDDVGKDERVSDAIERVISIYITKEKEEMATDDSTSVDKMKIFADFAFTELGTGLIGRMDEQGNVFDLTIKVRGRVGGQIPEYDPREPDRVDTFNVDDLVRLRNQIDKVVNDSIRLGFYKDHTTRGT